jgi:hypothetical protein
MTMKESRVAMLLILTLFCSGCRVATTPSDEESLVYVVDQETIGELQIDDTVVVNGNSQVTENLSRYDFSSTEMEEDMTLFTPEDMALLDNIENQDWLYQEDPTWMLRFDDDLLIIGQEKGQVTDVLKYHITTMDHSNKQMIIHIVERINEHSQTNITSKDLSYYCELVVTNDQLVYKNRINNPELMTETIWTR